MNVNADAAPSAWEASFAASAIHASVARQASQTRDPRDVPDATLIAGGRIYLSDCVGCHGEPGKPPSEFGATFYPRAPQFPLVGSQYSQAQLFWVARHGIRMTGMYPQSQYSDDELTSVAAFISSFRKLPPPVVRAIQPSKPN